MKNELLQNETQGYAYAIGNNPLQPQVMETSYPAEYQNFYLKNRLALKDPIALIGAMRANRGKLISLNGDELKRPIFEFAKSYGADSNTVYSYNFGGSLMIVGMKLKASHSETTLEAIQLEARRIQRQELVNRIPSLTEREFEAMEYFEQGYTPAEIAHEMNISLQMVDKYKANIKKRLGLTNWTCAVALYSQVKWNGICPID